MVTVDANAVTVRADIDHHLPNIVPVINVEGNAAPVMNAEGNAAPVINAVRND